MWFTSDVIQPTIILYKRDVLPSQVGWSVDQSLAKGVCSDMSLKLRPETALTFDDVLLVPKRSAIRSRYAVNTRSHFSRHIALSIPIISANMDTVTEWSMARAMARLGGIGVVHRFMTIERQAAEVQR